MRDIAQSVTVPQTTQPYDDDDDNDVDTSQISPHDDDTEDNYKIRVKTLPKHKCSANLDQQICNQQMSLNSLGMTPKPRC